VVTGGNKTVCGGGGRWRESSTPCKKTISIASGQVLVSEVEYRIYFDVKINVYKKFLYFWYFLSN
jgi:hypothetical protein